MSLAVDYSAFALWRGEVRSNPTKTCGKAPRPMNSFTQIDHRYDPSSRLIPSPLDCRQSTSRGFVPWRFSGRLAWARVDEVVMRVPRTCASTDSSLRRQTMCSPGVDRNREFMRAFGRY